VKHWFWILMIFGACSPGNKITGTKAKDALDSAYFSHYQDQMHYSSLLLEPEGNFVYDWKDGYMSGRSIGNWVVDKDAVLLKSFYEPPVIPLEKNFITSDTIDSTTIAIIDYETGFYYPFIELIILSEDESIRAMTNSNGYLKLDLSSEEISTVILADKNYGVSSIPVDTNFNLVEIVANKEYTRPYYRFFINESWQLKDSILHPQKVKNNIYPQKKFKKSPYPVFNEKF